MNHTLMLIRSIAFIALFMSATFVSAGEGPPPRVSGITPSCAAPGETVSLAGHGFGAKNLTIQINGQIAEILKATGNIAYFLVPSTNLPGLTTVTAVNPGGQTGSIDFRVKGSEICGNGIDDDCDGTVDETSECPLTSVEIDTSPFDITISPGETRNISTTTSLSASGSEPFTVNVTQKITELSGQAGGIMVLPNIEGGFTKSTDHTTVDNQIITAISEGVYEIKTEAEIVETGEVVSDVVRVSVEIPSGSLNVHTPGSIPGGLAPGTTTPVTFTTQVTGAESATSVGVVLSGDIVITLNDLGISGDIASDDGTFSGTTIIDTTGLMPGTCISVSATAIQGSETAVSNLYDLCVSSFPLKITVSDLTNRIINQVSGEQVIADEVLIIVSPGTVDSVISQIAASVDGTVIGSIPGLDTYQIKLQSSVTSSAQLNQILFDLEEFNAVISANPNGIVTLNAIDDSILSQEGFEKIRADEARFIARGGKTIAVIDTGVDLDHPDLESRLIWGKDFVDGGYEPDDEYGHGTGVAGIAAGIALNSNILAIRVFDENAVASAPPEGTESIIAEAIKYAADEGAGVINVSAGGGEIDQICSAVAYARTKGSLVVAAAGNFKKDDNGNFIDNPYKSYPAACASAISVGSTTPSDTRSLFSNYGSWVDIAAPGEQIMSTTPKGGTCHHCNSSGYKNFSGTSFSAPMVAGAAAVVYSRQSKLGWNDIETRLKRTAVKLSSSAQLGDGRIDLFEAVFNGSFEEGNLALWDVEGTVATKPKLGSISPQHRERMGSVSTGPAGTEVSGTLSQSFTIQPGVTSFPLFFWYAFISEEYPEYVGTVFDDSLEIVLITPAGNSITLTEESVNTSTFTEINGIDFQGGDDTVGWTGWKFVDADIPVTEGTGTYRILLQDAGDAVFDTEVLIDEIKFKHPNP